MKPTHSFITLIFITVFSTIAWAQKSLELDLEKSNRSKEECERISAWSLLKVNTQNLKIECGIDNLQFKADVPMTSSTQHMRLGNYNLLHPGTDKTLFKDMVLTAELINQEFDVMAGVELVDVVAAARTNNISLRPLLEQKIIPVKNTQEQIKNHLKDIQKLEALVNSAVVPSANKAQLENKLKKEKNDLRVKNTVIKKKKADLLKAEKNVELHSQPKLDASGKEKNANARLKNLAKATQKRNALSFELQQLEAEQKELSKVIANLTAQISTLPSGAAPSKADVNRLEDLKKDLVQLKNNLKKQEEDFQQIARFYRIPGYLRLLEELRKMDASWSLVVSPHGDAAVESNTQELVGFYYRASRVTLASNVHCSQRYKKDSVACYPNFYEDYMGDNMANFFSRRPFLATFTDNSSSFSMLASHVIFEPPKKTEEKELMLQKTFGVKDPSALPTGINNQNFARFAEVLISLQMVDRLKREGVPHLIYTGDLNLESKNPFWQTIFQKVPGYQVLIDGETSLSETRFARGAESNGVSSNYDHFILSKEDTAYCKNASVINFLNNGFSQKIKDKYLIRVEAEQAPYSKIANAQSIIKTRSAEMELILQDLNVLIGAQSVSSDSKKTADDLKKFVERVFDSQFSDSTYYKMFSQIMSDHLPIKLECRF